MVSFYRPPVPATGTQSLTLDIASLDGWGRGVGRHAGQVYFVPGALPGEQVRICPAASARSREGRLVEILTACAQRQPRFCALQGRCGGCPLYYAPPELILQAKAEAVQRLFSRQGAAELGEAAQIVASPPRHYRRAARLAADCRGPRTVLGFREAHSHRIVAVRDCPILTAGLSALLAELPALLDALPCRRLIGHLELVEGEEGRGLALRLNGTPGAEDRSLLEDFARRQQLTLSWLSMPAAPEAGALGGGARAADGGDLHEEILAAAGGLWLSCGAWHVEFSPGCFVQVNAQVGAALMQRLVAEVRSAAPGRVLDLFCGCGTWAFACAAWAAEVVGCDCSALMIAVARRNAHRLGLRQLRFYTLNLDDAAALQRLLEREAPFETAIIDPGRRGARTALAVLLRRPPQQVIMISCNPSTCSRDCAALHAAGYQLQNYAIFDMFAYTKHLEIMMNYTRK